MAKEQPQQTKSKSATKIKKKIWCKIISPKVFGNKEVGESYLASPESAVGRKLKINLKDLTGNIKNQNVYIQFLVNKTSGSLLNTTVVGYELTPAYVKRMIKKNINRLDDCFNLKTKSGKDVVLKSLIITLYKTNRSVQSQLKRELIRSLTEEMSQGSFDYFVNNLINYKIQANLKKRLTKIFPVREVAVRALLLKGNTLKEEEIIVEDQTQTEQTSSNSDLSSSAAESESVHTNEGDKFAEKEAEDTDSEKDEEESEDNSA